ncbi:MAG: hypothetical protein E7012_05135 [Alphaproteobacteria bacterium]|nr:hypothetical protein [Alphaproteobacteria bacterium]
MQNLLMLLPEISLISYFPVAFIVNRYRDNKTAKTFFTLSRFFLLISILFTVIFYNKSVIPNFMLNSQYSSMFKFLTYISAFVWFYLSSKWFLNKNRTSYLFYMVGMGMVLFLGVMISAQNLVVLMSCIPLICILTYTLIKQHWDEDKIKYIARNYLFLSLIFITLLYSGCFIIKYYIGSFNYHLIKEYINSTTSVPVLFYTSLLMILSCILFMMSVAPFHIWFVDVVSVSILPVCGFLTLILPLAYLSCFISLIINVFGNLQNQITPILQSVAFLSLFIGALSANGENNIRRLFAYCSVYNIGFILLGILSFGYGAVLSSFIYTIIYIMAMMGIYTVFLGLKSRGDYRSDLYCISGMSEVKPYISAAFLVFMVSLIGVPPLLGFWGRLSLINTLVVENRWIEALVVMVAIIIIANAFLHIIRKIYFEPLAISFDRTDKAIYICLFINLLLVIITILNPSYLLNDIEAIFGTVIK